LQQFGRALPATGFALKTNRIIDGVHGITIEEKRPVRIKYSPDRRAEALTEAARLRNMGHNVVTSLIADEKADTIPATSETTAEQDEQVIIYGTQKGGH
jgi:ATP phosphoribosyltransferase regulatory subunit